MTGLRKQVIQLFDLDCLPFAYWDDATVISFLQRQVIVHSILYYVLNTSCISDKQFDALSHKLVELQSTADKEELERSQYYYVFYDFDGSTGFDLPDRLTESDRDYLTKIAGNVKKCFEKQIKANKRGIKK